MALVGEHQGGEGVGLLPGVRAFGDVEGDPGGGRARCDAVEHGGAQLGEDRSGEGHQSATTFSVPVVLRTSAPGVLGVLSVCVTLMTPSTASTAAESAPG